MSADEDILFDFMDVIATVHRGFNSLAISAGKHPAVRDAHTAVYPAKMRRISEYADRGLLISLALDARLVKPRNRDQAALGVSLLLRRSLGTWIAEAEVGWTGVSIGWDSFDSREGQADQFTSLVPQIPGLTDWLSARFQEELTKLAQVTPGSE